MHIPNPVRLNPVFKGVYRCGSLVYCLVGACLLVGPNCSFGQNLLVNGSFELGATPWTISSPYAISTNAAVIAADGSVALVLPLFDTNNPAPATVSQTFDTAPGEEYVLRFFYNGRESGQSRIFAGANELPALNLDGAAAVEGWGYVRRSFVADSPRTTLRLEVQLNTPGLVSFDAFEVVLSPSPESTSVVQFQTAEVTLAEGSIAPIEIQRSGATDRAAFASLEYRPADLSPAEPLLDFSLLRSLSGAPSFDPRRIGVYFPPGATSCVVGFKALRDVVVEGNEQGSLRLAATGNADIGSQAEMKVTITDKEPSGRAVLTPSPGVNENAAGFITVRIQLLDGFCGSIRARTVSGGTATPGSDYTPVDYTWPATNASELRIDVPVLRDGLPEDAIEFILMEFESLDGRTELNLKQLGLWIEDVDGFDLQIVASPREGPNQGEVTFTRSKMETPLSLDVSTREGTAKPGVDYQATTTRLHFPAGEYSSSVRIPIIDRPGLQGFRGFYLDLTNATAHLRASTFFIGIEDWPSSRPGPFGNGQDVPTERAPVALGAADMDGDGTVDLVVASRSEHPASVLMARNGSFIPASSEPSPSDWEPTSLIVVDFDRDGNLDVATANRKGNSISLFYGDGTGKLAAPEAVSLPAGAQPVSLASADFNGDGYPDVVSANGGSNQFVLFLGDGKGGLVGPPRNILAVNFVPQQVLAADFNNDGNPDIAAAHGTGDFNFISVYFGNGRGDFERVPGSPYQVGGGPASLAAADLNGDGLLDIACLDSPSGIATFLLSRRVDFGNGRYNLPGMDRLHQSVAILDANADGVPDLAVAANGTVPETSGIYVVLGTKFGLEEPASSVFLPVGGRIAAMVAADLNGDGRTDLAAAREDSGLRIFYNVQGETNAPAKLIVLPSEPVTESVGQATVIFRRDSHLNDEQSFFLKTAPGTAKPGIDYVDTEQRMVFHPGEVEVSAAIPLLDDDWYSGDRAILLELSEASPALQLPHEAAIAIRDDDTPVTFSFGGAASESAGNVVLTISRFGSLESDRVVKVKYELAAGEPPSAIPGVDFAPASGVLEFGKGVADQTILLPILNNDRVDGTRSFRLVLTNIENFVSGSVEQPFSIFDDERAVLEHTIPWSHFGARGTRELTLVMGARAFAVSTFEGRFAVVAVTATGAPSTHPTARMVIHFFPPGRPFHCERLQVGESASTCGLARATNSSF